MNTTTELNQQEIAHISGGIDKNKIANIAVVGAKIIGEIAGLYIGYDLTIGYSAVIRFAAAASIGGACRRLAETGATIINKGVDFTNNFIKPLN